MEKKVDDISVEHAQWLVESRTKNQELSLMLYRLMDKHERQFAKFPELRPILQELCAICFSLWRSVFLTDITKKPEHLFKDSRRFLGNIILHNTIGYVQDRNDREWSFIYYLDNARLRLTALHRKDRGLFIGAPEGDLETVQKASKTHWRFVHETSHSVIQEFEKRLLKATDDPKGYSKEKAKARPSI